MTTPESYLDVAEADAYFSTRLNSDVWDDASDGNKNKALITATRQIDTLRYYGVKAVSTQVLEFPRDPNTYVPDNIKIATCEIAIVLLDDFDMEMERESLTATTSSYAAVRDTYDRTIAVEHLMAGIASRTAWDYIKPYLADPNSIRLSRVN